MRGSPLIRALLMAGAMLTLLIPIRRLTGDRPEPRAVVSTPPAVAAATVPARITSSRMPCSFTISHLGKTVWSGEMSSPSMRNELSMAFPPEGVDLVVKVSWPDDAPSAFRIAVGNPSGETTEHTIWGTREGGGVLTFR